MIRNLLLAAAFTGLTAASAFAAGPRLVGEGDAPHVVYDAPSANIVGGANATVTGTPDTAHYETRRVFHTQAPSDDYSYGTNQPWQIQVDSNN